MMNTHFKRLFDEKNITRIKELFRYGIIGLSTTVVNLASFHVMLLFLDYRIANLIALLVAKTYGFFANKIIVFHSKTESLKGLLAEVVKYVFARGFTALVDYFGLIIAVEWFGFGKIISKYVLQVVVIVLNYIFGKFVVFKSKEERERNSIL